jgi:hypothetical protein
MEPENQVEFIAGEPLMAYESDFADYEPQCAPSPPPQAEANTPNTAFVARLQQVSAALALLEASQDDPCAARQALELAVRIKQGSLKTLSADHTPADHD